MKLEFLNENLFCEPLQFGNALSISKIFFSDANPLLLTRLLFLLQVLPKYTYLFMENSTFSFLENKYQRDSHPEAFYFLTFDCYGQSTNAINQTSRYCFLSGIIHIEIKTHIQNVSLHIDI